MILVEEIARAIWARDGSVWPDELQAKAALSVILQRLREPDEGMIEAVYGKGFSGELELVEAFKRDLRAIADHLEGK